MEKATRSLMKKPLALLNLQDANGTEIIFNEPEPGERPSVGDTATIDGLKAEGVYTMPDGTLIKFVEGVVTKITEPPEDTKDTLALAKNEGKNLFQVRHINNSFVAIMEDGHDTIKVGNKMILNGVTDRTGTYNGPNGIKFKLFNGKLVKIIHAARTL